MSKRYDERRVKRMMTNLRDDLEDTQPLVNAYAEAVLREAQARAAGRPTPQAPMAAEAMGIQGTSITVLTGGPPAEVSGGSEWGSSLYPQFGPRNEGGYWLMPSTESAPVLEAGDRYLEQIAERAVRSY